MQVSLTIPLRRLVQQTRLVRKTLVDLLDDAGERGVDVRGGLDGLDGADGVWVGQYVSEPHCRCTRGGSCSVAVGHHGTARASQVVQGGLVMVRQSSPFPDVRRPMFPTNQEVSQPDMSQNTLRHAVFPPVYCTSIRPSRNATRTQMADSTQS